MAEKGGETLKTANIILNLKTGQKENLVTNPNLSSSFWFLETSRSVSSWSTFLSARKQFYLGTVITDAPSVDFAWAALPWQSDWIVDEGETVMLFRMSLVRDLKETLFQKSLSWYFSIETMTLQSELMENYLGKNLCEWSRICRSEALQRCILGHVLFFIIFIILMASLSITWSRGEEEHLEEWPGGTLMHFIMDKWKAQQLRLSFPFPPQCYILWIDYARAALQTQSWRIWQGGAAQVPMTLSVSGINSTLGYMNRSTGVTSREMITPSVQHSLDHILITQTIVGPFNIR